MIRPPGPYKAVTFKPKLVKTSSVSHEMTEFLNKHSRCNLQEHGIEWILVSEISRVNGTIIFIFEQVQQ